MTYPCERRWIDNHKDHVRERQHQWFANHPDYRKQWCAKHKLRMQQLRARWSKGNSLKIKAERQANRIGIASRCSNCGSTTSLVRHHPDYNLPKSFVTLCGLCHRQLHVGILKVKKT
jgi:hypothetical protein